MKKKQLLILCKEYAEKFNDEPYVHYSYREKKEDKPEVDYFRVEWVSGGRSGGSCWDTGDPVYYSQDGEPEKELEGLNEMLEKHFSNMSFLTYKKFDKYVNRDSYSKDEYYGNYTSYGVKTIKFEDVHKVLKAAGLL